MRSTIHTVGPRRERRPALALDHKKWRAVSSHLMAAARVLWPRIAEGFNLMSSTDPDIQPLAGEGLRLRGPFYLLAGLAVENAIKAVIVQRRQYRGKPVTEGVRFKVSGNHDLVTLCADAQISLTKAERTLLTRLSDFVSWRGRYPVPLNLNKLGDSMTSDGDLRAIEELMKKLERVYLAGREGNIPESDAFDIGG